MSLSDVKAYVVAHITRQSGDKYVQAFPNAWSSFVEVQATSQLASAKGDAAVPLAQVTLEARYGKEAWTTNVWAVGARVGGNCRYLRAMVAAGLAAEQKIGEGVSISVRRASEADPGTLTIMGKSVDLCLLFAPPKGTVGPAAMSFAGQRIALGDVLSAPPEGTTPRFDAAALARTYAPKAALTLGAAAALGVAWFGWRRYRTRRRYVLTGSTLPGEEPAVPAETRAETTPIDAPAEAPSALQVCARHCRVNFAPVATTAGPGREDFEAGQRALQVKSNHSAEQLLARAIEIGLDPTYACGAWAFRGKAALRQGRGEQAIRCFLAALEGEQVTQQAAHLASSHLAVIYRELGWRADARIMERLAAASGPADIVHDKRFVDAVRKGLRRSQSLRGR